MTYRPARTPRRPRRTRRTWIPRVAIVLVALLVFALGIALGEALHDNPRPGGSLTRERTFSVPPGSSTFRP